METIDYFRQMPKIELHVHLESTIDGEKLENYAAKRGKRLPRPGNEMYNCSADDLSNFLLFLDFICGVAGCLEDLEEIAYDFSIRSGKENIIYAEAILNPTHWPQFNIEQIIGALTSGFDRGSKDGGSDCRFMLSLSRKQSLHEATELVNVMKLHRTPRLLGLSIDGNEALSGRTGERFAPAFLQAKQAGFGITVHAGESSGPEGVRDALDILHADRLDHGVRASEDSELITRLVQEQIALNICLTSNLTLLYRNPKEHPLRKLWEAGVRITLNRDDPTFLNLELTEELKRCAAFSDLSISDILQAQYNAVEAAFCNSEEKTRLRAVLDDFSEKLSLHV